MERFDFNYDSESDDLFIYQRDKKSSGGVEIGDFILDFDDKGDLVALQILNTSQFLSKILEKIKQVSEIKEIKLEIINFRNMKAIKFKVSNGSIEESANILIPHIKQKSPVLNY